MTETAERLTPWYTDAEIDSLCEGLTQDAAKVKYLRSLGLHVERKPNGRALVLRAHADLVLSGRAQIDAEAQPPAKPRPDREAFILQFRKKAAT